MHAIVLRFHGWLVAGLALAAAAFGVFVLRPVMTLEARRVANRPKSTRVVLRPVPVEDEANPAVQPGLVRWHRTFADAQIAAAASARPVLLFHMMGQLDRQFC